MNKLFDWITGLVNGAEDSLINLISAVILWMVPIVPAYLTYQHNITDLKFPAWVAWTTAFVVEFLGLASMRTSIKFYEHNKRYTTEYKKAPFWPVVGTYAFYIVVVLSVNVLLDWGKVEGTHVWAIALFSLLSVPAGYLISARAQHTELLRQIENDKEKARENKKQSKEQKVVVPEEKPKVYASSKRQEIVDLLTVIWETEHRVAMPKELSDRLELDADTSKGYISSLTKNWKIANHIE